ncbi:MAG: hypothetical protein RIB59_14450 [Rhodospirillales bacterium]
MTLNDSVKEHGKFRLEIEQAITLSNREVMNNILPPVNRKTVLPFAIAVARLRGEYLKAAFALGAGGRSEAPVEAELKTLRKHREAYEEGVAAFEALMRAIDRGYIELDDAKPDAKKTPAKPA